MVHFQNGGHCQPLFSPLIFDVRRILSMVRIILYLRTDNYLCKIRVIIFMGGKDNTLCKVLKISEFY